MSGKPQVIVLPDAHAVAAAVTQRLVARINESREAGQPCVLGLPTGKTPIGVYHHLVHLHREGSLDFSHVVTFNLDEYYPMPADSPHSYHRFMHHHLFDHVSIPPAHIHIPDGTVDDDKVADHARWYEQQIQKHGGLDVVLLGIGRNGHIGFNEPGAGPETRTRRVQLGATTRTDALADFMDAAVPREAISMGVGTMLDAREIILMATGAHKADIIHQALTMTPDVTVPASFLQSHPAVCVLLDEAAAQVLNHETA